MIGQFFAPLAIKIFSGITLALLIALGFALWRADSLSDARDEAQRQLVTEEARHAVTRQSLASLAQRLTDMVRDGELRQERLSDAMMEVRQETAELRRQADMIESGEIDYRDAGL